ncbi:MAG: hypothetical protein EA355_14025 [Rhodobacteraceae bacterium]|nr:MAG: hypothetical protein EA355_14025 [Paracoccaceae bacterium]
MTDALDPRGLIREAYRIEGVTAWDCRSIYLDWALGLAGDPAEATRALLARYGPAAPDHPMTAVLREGVDAAPRPPGARPRRRRPDAAPG